MARAVPGVVLEGFKETSRKLRAIPEETREQAYEAIRVTTFSARQRAVAGAPRASGTLKSSIYSTTHGLTGRVLVSPAAFYWRFIEYGTRFQPARPFVRPAAEAETNAFNERVRQIGMATERSWESGRSL
jgi:HK97 gp10 family phage protein